jgi:hypothetical protein
MADQPAPFVDDGWDRPGGIILQRRSRSSWRERLHLELIAVPWYKTSDGSIGSQVAELNQRRQSNVPFRR